MNKYPEYIKKYRPKGTIIKKTNNKYYVYKATSKRVEGKSYPVQVIEGVIGYIDEQGFHNQKRTLVETSSVVIRECGFTNYLLLFKDSFTNDINAHHNKKDALSIFYSLIVYLSNNSFLVDQKEIPILSITKLNEKYSISLPKQINAIVKVTNVKDIKSLEPLKYICHVKIGNKIFKSDLNDFQKEIIEELGVDADEIR